MSAYDPGEFDRQKTKLGSPSKSQLTEDVTIELEDDSEIKLNKEVASKLEAVRDVISDIGRYDMAVPFTSYPPEDIRLYLKLMKRIDKREALANIRLTQLFKLINVAEYLGNGLSVDNLADYILATTLAARNMSKEVRKAVQINYQQLISPLINDLIMDGLDAHLQSISVTKLRYLNLNGWNIFYQQEGAIGNDRDIRDRLAIDEEGRIVASLLTKNNMEWRFYDETNAQREKTVNQFITKDTSRYNRVRIRVGGMTEKGIIVIAGHLDSYLGWYIHTIYFPGQPGRSLNHLITGKWRIFPLAPRLEVLASLTGSEQDDLDDLDQWDKILRSLSIDIKFKIYDLASDQMLFNFGLRERDVYTDDLGRYLVVITNFIREGMVIERFLIDQKTVKGQSDSFKKRVSRMSIRGHFANNCVIDPYRKLLYVFDREGKEIKKEGLWTWAGGIESTTLYRKASILLVITFGGKVLHRYIYITELSLYPTAKHLITVESKLTEDRTGLGRNFIKDDLAELEAEDLQRIGWNVNFSRKDKFNLVDQNIVGVVVPPYELWPAVFPEVDLSNIELNDYGLYLDQYRGVWIRDVTDGFKPLALIENWVQHNANIVSSPSGDYIFIGHQKTRHPLSARPVIVQTSLYSQKEVQIISNLLETSAG